MGVVKRRKKSEKTVKTSTKTERPEQPGNGKPLSIGSFFRFHWMGTPWREALLFLFLLADFFVIATVLTPWTGEWGRTLSGYLLNRIGGAVLLPEIFLAYLVMGVLLSRKISGLLKQIIGTLFLTLCTALLFGLAAFQGQPLPFRFAVGGRLGDGMATFLLTNLGALGTTFCGFALVVMAWLFLCPEQSSDIMTRFLESLFRFGGSLRLRISEIWPCRKKSERRRARMFDSTSQSPEQEVRLDEDVEAVEEAVEGSVIRRVGATLKTKLPKWKNASSPSKEKVPPDCPTEFPPEAGEANQEAESGGDGNIHDESEKPDNGQKTFGVATGTDNLQSHFEKQDVDEATEGAISELDVEAEDFPPPAAIFGPPPDYSGGPQTKVLEEKGFQIISTLAEFGIEAELAEMMVGPTVIQYRIQLAPGIKVSRVAGLSNDLAVALAVPSLRVEAPIPGKPFVGVEIPNPERQAIPLRQILEEDDFFDSDYDLPLPVGACVDGQSLVIGLEDLPHLLVAGTTGSGKSVFVNSCIVGLCASRSPRELRLILVDPKRVEMSFYEKLPHTLHAPIVDAKKAIHALAWAVREMERRYELFASTRVRNLAGYNAKADPKQQLPHIVIVVDELADLMMTSPKEVEDYICRLAQMARATGIHLLLATQRPSVNVITGLIKANVPARVAFTLPSQADSRTIIDVSGAERLLGKGDMLFLSPRFPKAIRVQSPWIEEARILAFIDYLVRLFGEPEHIDIEEQGGAGNAGSKNIHFDDPLIQDAVRAVLNTGIASASRLQRQLRVGFTRAARLVDAMEDMGIVGPPDGSKPREILVDDQRAEELLQESLGV